MSEEQRSPETALKVAFEATDAWVEYLSELLAMKMALDDLVSGKASYPLSEVPPALEDLIVRASLCVGLLQEALADVQLAMPGGGQ